MKQYIIYECDNCGKQSKDRGEIMKCEASHLGLTITEMQEWKNLKENARHVGAVVNVTKNEQTDKAFDEAIEKLLAFEKEHGICQ